MKSLQQVIKDNSQYKKLINAVISNIGEESVSDVNNHGINGGFSGFIYYTETHAFAMKHRKQIIQLLEEMADSMGEEVVSMVKNFGVFKGEMDKDEMKELYSYLGGGRTPQGQVTNVMAWFAAEEVCRMFED